MPELPEVEIQRRYATKHTLYQKIVDLEVRANRVLEFTTEQDLQSKVIGEEFIGTNRHGKYLFLELSNENVLPLHFGMSGRLSYFDTLDEVHKHTRMLITFENQKYLAFINQMKLGKISVASSKEEFVKKKKLGPDALQIDKSVLVDMLSNKRGSIKYTLMKQQYIAGLGNIYIDEILFQDGIHPKTTAKDLNKHQAQQLYTTIQTVLTTAIEKGANIPDYPKSYLLPVRGEKKNGHCPSCGNQLDVIKVSGRTTVFCNNCQKKM